MRTRAWIALMAMAAVGGLAGCSDETDATLLQAVLTGGNEVPPVATGASGVTGFSVEGNIVHWSIELHNITSVIGAHIHSGAGGVNGPIRVSLFPGGASDFSATASGPVNGLFLSGSFTAADVRSISYDQIISEMRAGTAYVNVHTTARRPGEIRGQIQVMN